MEIGDRWPRPRGSAQRATGLRGSAWRATGPRGSAQRATGPRGSAWRAALWLLALPGGTDPGPVAQAGMCLSLDTSDGPAGSATAATRHLDMLGPALGLCRQMVQFSPQLNLRICTGGKCD